MGVLILAKYKTVEDFVLKYLIGEKKVSFSLIKKEQELETFWNWIHRSGGQNQFWVQGSWIRSSQGKMLLLGKYAG